MIYIYIKSHDVSVCVGSNSDELLSYIKKYFSDFCIDETITEPDISLVFNIKSGFGVSYNSPFSSKYSKRWGDLIAEDSDGNIIFRYKEFSGEFIRRNNGRWFISVNFKRNFFKHLSILLFFNKGNVAEQYYRVMARLFVQNLLFLRLKNKKVNLLCGGVGVFQKNAYAFIGLPGSGKSTILSYLSKELSGFEVLADNYVLVNEDKMVLPFSEGVRPVSLEKKAKLKVIFLVSYGDNFSINSIGAQEAVEKIMAINQFTSELPHDGIMSILQFFGIENSPTPLSGMLDSLNGMNFFCLTVDKKKSSFLKYFLDKFYVD